MNFCDGTTWMHSPFRMSFLHFATISAYSSADISGVKPPGRARSPSAPTLNRTAGRSRRKNLAKSASIRSRATS